MIATSVAAGGNALVVGGHSRSDVGSPGSADPQDLVRTWDTIEPLELPPLAACLVADHETALRAVAAFQRAGGTGELLIAAANRADEALLTELRADGFTVLGPDGTLLPTASRDPVPARIWLLTSGSTGRPKRVAHTMASLTTVGGAQPPRRWLCAYGPGAYAWWQVVTLTLAHQGQDAVFVAVEDLDQWPVIASRHGVTAVSGTPTFWRQALVRSAEVLRGLPLAQLTLGGEPVDQAVLDRLAGLFPAARVSWIYASSEAGAAIAVHDGLAGFPVRWLDREAPGRPRLRIDDGELVLSSPHSAVDQDRLLRTGDRAVVSGDRVLITGRLGSDEINVGGAKVSAGVVRDVLQAHPQVAWAAVRGRRAPMVGQLVVADVVPVDGAYGADGADGDLAVELTRWCAARLPEHAVPRRITLLPEIPIKESLKSDV